MTPFLYHFAPWEFREWFPNMDTRLLVLLDAWRNIIDTPINISPAGGAIGRNDGDSHSQHNFDRWEQVRAADVMIPTMRDQMTAGRYIRHATRVGFTGIGIYPHWKPYPGMHVDVRRDREPGDPATWGMVRDAPESAQRTVSMDFAISQFPL